MSGIKKWAERVVRRLKGKRPVHFLHIGKTGGTAVRHALQGHPETPRFVLRLHPHEVRLPDVPVGEGVVFFLRDPVRRFVSAFLSRQRQGQPRYLSPWNEDEQAAFETFATPNELAEALTAPDAERREKAEKAMSTIRVLKDSYWTWFEDKAYFRSRAADLFFIGYQESLPEDFETLKGKLGLPAGLSLPDDDVQAHRTPAHLDRRLTDEAVRNLTEWYRSDYEFLRMCQGLSGRPAVAA